MRILTGFLGLYMYVSHKDVFTIVKALSSALVIITTADLLRFTSRRFARTYERLLGFLMRESEKVTQDPKVPGSFLTHLFIRQHGTVSSGIWSELSSSSPRCLEVGSVLVSSKGILLM